MSRLVTIGLLSGLLLASTGCRKHESARPAPSAAKESYEVRKTYGAGPVTFTTELSAWSITTADVLKCRLTLESAKGYEAEFPDIAFPEDMPGSVLTHFDEQESSSGDRRVVTREYELEPELEGKLVLPKLEVFSHRAGEVKEDVLETEPLEVTVKPSRELAGDAVFKPMHGLVTVDQIEAQRRRVWPWILSGVVVALLAATGIVYLMRRPRKLPPPPPAHETALQRLRQLAGRGLIAAGATEAFFVEVTGIIRDYIEQAFGVRAPEQTTEEFLSRMATAPAVVQHRHVLEPFLTAADEVKFAQMRPDSTAMQKAFDTAESFVVQSAGLGSEKP